MIYHWRAIGVAEFYSIDTRDILVDLGRSRMMGGHMDMSVNVAFELKRVKAKRDR